MAAFVREILSDGKLTQGELAEMTHIDQAIISKMSRATPSGWSWDSVVALAEFKGCNPLEIVAGTVHDGLGPGEGPEGDLEHPERGKVLERMRGILRQDALDKVRGMVLPPGVRWTSEQWARVLLRVVDELEKQAPSDT